MTRLLEAIRAEMRRAGTDYQEILIMIGFALVCLLAIWSDGGGK